MEPNSFKQSINNYVSSLHNHIEFLQQQPALQFETMEIDCSVIGEDFKIWELPIKDKGVDKGCSVLYYLSFENYDPAQILKAAKDRKERKSFKLAIPQINETRRTNILYVGKCNTNFPSRLKYHLGLGGTSTYALNLKHWAQEWKFTLHYCIVCFPNHQEEIQYLEHIETALHNSLQPLLGRSGH